MKRSGWVTGVTVIHLLLALTLVGITIYLLVLARSPEILSEKDGAEAAHGLRIAAAICSPVALLYFVSVHGLWRHKLWGWWLGFLLNLAAAGTLIYSVIDDGWRASDATDIALPIVLIVLLVLFVIPAVRRHYWADTKQEVAIEGKQA